MSKSLTVHTIAADQVVRSLEKLEHILQQFSDPTIAVSGGIDSTLLAVIAGRLDGVQCRMFHAISPAVPQHATTRVEEFASRENWDITFENAGEFSDPDYLKNPVDRCYYCKTHLYQYIRNLSEGTQVLSGTNADDLSDFRPGLQAAANHSVRHPYVEAGIDKSRIREIARMLKLHDLSELPASPCLSSRVETGIGIQAPVLQAIDKVESFVKTRFDIDVVRCRVRKEAVEIELDSNVLSGIGADEFVEIVQAVRANFTPPYQGMRVSIGSYRMGSAFIGANR